MLNSLPPGYQASPMNRQTLGGLASPGWQSHATTLGNSSFSQPSSFGQNSTTPHPSNMNQYFKSGNGNLSTLLRVLNGRH